LAQRRAEEKLTTAFLEGDLAPGKYHDGGNLGLYLRVEPKGQRFWVQRITIQGKRREMGLGSYPLIDIQYARERAIENKRIAYEGGDPLELRRLAKKGKTPADAKSIAAPTVPNPAAAADTNSQPLIEEDWPALAPYDLARWWKDLSSRDEVAARALRFATLTMTTVADVRQMLWADVDLTAGIWAIPASRSSTRQDRRIPLSGLAGVALRQREASAGSRADEPTAFVFANPSGTALSEMAISSVMHRMHEEALAGKMSGYADPRSGRPAVPLGMRTTFQEWANENGAENEIIQLALRDGAPKSRKSAALLDLMEDWARALRGAAAAQPAQKTAKAPAPADPKRKKARGWAIGSVTGPR
jgi:integrase